VKKALIFAPLLFLVCVAATAEESDELIVAAIRADNTKIPGTSLKRPADFIVQRLRVSSESKEEKTRKEEIFETLRLLVATAKEKGIEVVPGVSNAVVQYSKLREFPASLKPAGRSAVDLQGYIEVSIVNPGQYRAQVIKLYADDAKLVTSSLSADYRVVTRGIDRQLQWMREGMTDVVLFIPYEYDVVPVNAIPLTRTVN
jgi:hypothetical protein